MRNLFRSSWATGVDSLWQRGQGLTRTLVPAAVLGLGILGTSGTAHAGCSDQTLDVSNDLALECLIAPRNPNDPDPNNRRTDPNLREQSMYRSLLSELGAVMAVPAMEPADTTGFSGFHFSFDVNATSISINNAYWSGYKQPNGTNALAGARHVSGQYLPVASIMLRKGVWFLPLPFFPSLEVGFGASNLVQSSIFGLNGYLKFALHEGYHDIPIPSIAARATVTRIAGAPQIDMTVITVEGIMSKAFGAKGTMTFEPYLGGGAAWNIVRSQVIDVAPTFDLYRGDPSFNTPAGLPNALSQKITFPTQPDIFRWRVFAGLNLHYAIVSITGYFSYWGAGEDNGYDINTLPTGSDLGGTPGGAAAACRTDNRTMSKICPKDLSYSQFSIGGSIGLRF
jgi:hypothetical protein